MSAAIQYCEGKLLKAGTLHRMGIVILLIFIFSHVYCQQASYDEVAITMNVERIGSTEVSALIKGEALFLSATEVFDFLKITHSLSAAADSISGAITDPKDVFLIDASRFTITYHNAATVLRPGELVTTENGVYLEASFFGKLFGLDCSFNFRNLLVTLSVKADLPLLREKQQELIRKNLNRFRGSKKADTTIRRNFSFFKLGMADWMLTASQGKNAFDYTRGSLALGGIFAGGELDLYGNYSSNTGFDPTQQYFKWRYVNNETPFLRQITVGRLATNTLSTLQGPLSGLQLSNRATTYRHSFGTYTISNTTKPGWTVELYVDNVLLNYTTADASGFFTFDVPMVYGNSLVKLRFYGPSGEESSQEQMVSVPFNFLPAGQFEYNIAAGEVGDHAKSLFTRGDVSYGLSRTTTFGGGVERLSSAGPNPVFPFLNASLRFGNNTILSAEKAQGVRTKGSLSYRTTGNLQVQVNYIKYEQGQKAVIVPYEEEKSLILSFPSKWKWLNSFTRLTYQHFILPEGRSTNAELLISGSAYKINSNLTTRVTAYPNSMDIYSELSVTCGLPLNVRFTPLFQYDYTSGRVSRVKAVLEKTVFNNSAATLSYESSARTHFHVFSVGLRLNFSSVSSSFSALLNRSGSTFIQSAGGSLIYDRKTHYKNFSKNFSVGKGALSVVAYLDLNNNGVRDAKEPVAKGLKFSVNGGRVVQEREGSISRVLELEPYRPYLIEINPRSFDNLSWRIQHKTIAVETDPNHVKMVEIPVSVMSEASGYVAIKTPKGQKGLSRMIVNFYSGDSTLVGRTLTEDDGFFNFMDLTPGNYLATLDSAQLDLLELKDCPRSIAFTIKTSEEGVIADGFQFTVISKREPDDTASEDQHKSIKGEGPVTSSGEKRKPDSARQAHNKTDSGFQKSKQAHDKTDTRSQRTKQAHGKKDSGLRKSKQDHSSSDNKVARDRGMPGNESKKHLDKRAPSPFQRRPVSKAQADTASRTSASDHAPIVPTQRNTLNQTQDRDHSPGKKPGAFSHRKKERGPVPGKGLDKSAELKRGKIPRPQKANTKTAAPNERLKKVHSSGGTHAAPKKATKVSQPLKRKTEHRNRQDSTGEREKLLEQLKRLLERSRPQKAEMAFLDFDRRQELLRSSDRTEVSAIAV